MTTAELEAIEARANAATPGPWTTNIVHDVFAYHDDEPLVAQVAETSKMRENASFIATARADVTALLAEVKRLQSSNEELGEILGKAATSIEFYQALLNDIVALGRDPATTLEDVRAYVERLQMLRDGKPRTEVSDV